MDKHFFFGRFEYPKKRGVLEGFQPRKADTTSPNQEDEKDAEESIDEIEEKRFCRKCGNKLLDRAKFCNKCGTSVIKE